MGVIRWIVSLAVLTVWIAYVGTVLFVLMYEPPADVPEAQAIVVLGGSGDGHEGLGFDSRLRIATGIELFKSGKAPRLVLTGGGTPVRVAEVMAQEARDQGVPQDAILFEAESLSTLQNALFSGDFEQIDKAEPIILVTNRYHLPRAWASFRWAGFQDVIRVASDPDRGLIINGPELGEALKWPVNALRALAASAAMAGGVPRENYIKYLQ